MKKQFKRMLAMLLLAAMVLSCGVSALAAEDPVVESGPETEIDTGEDGEPEVGVPLPTPLGFDYRSVYISSQPTSNSFTVTIAEAAAKGSKGVLIKYGIAGYDPETKKASDLPGKSWQSPDNKGRVTFNDITSTYFIVTSTDSNTSTKQTPAGFYNSAMEEVRGVEFVLPTENLYNLMKPVDPSSVERGSDRITVKNTKTNQQYALYDSNSGMLINDWVRGDGGDQSFFPGKPLTNEMLAVTRMVPSSQYLVPEIPTVVPGGDVARTTTGYSPRTLMAVLTITATPGLEYAIAAEDGHILNLKQRLQWGITAETENGLNVLPDETNFYSTPAEGGQIRFRVPPGGKYYIVSRLPNCTTGRAEQPYQTVATKNNVQYEGRFDRYGKLYSVVIVKPASTYSEYTVLDKVTGTMTAYQKPKDGKVEIKLTVYRQVRELQVFARPNPLKGVSEDTPSTGQVSPGRETMPPVLNKPVNGTGETQDGQSLTAGPWDSNSSPFATGKDAVEDALGSGVGQLLNPKDFSGAALAGIAVEPTTMIVLYDWEGKPSSALYYYEQQWYSAPVVDLGDGTYMVNLREGLVGYIDIAE